jgi:hypothetical protein
MELNNAVPKIDSEIRQYRGLARPEQELEVTLLRSGDVLHLLRDRAVALNTAQTELPGTKDSQAPRLSPH